MTEKDDGLGLSLSLSLSIPEPNQQKTATFPVNPYKPFLKQSRCSRTDAFQLVSADKNVESRSLVPGTNMNQGVVVIDCEAEGVVSSPNSTVSSVSGKRSAERDENDGYRAVSSSLEADDDAAGRKKLRLSKEQATVLEEIFKEHHTLDQRRKVELGKQLNLTPRQVEVWFQNRRARTKLKQTEVDCEYLKRCCKNLTEENKRLQKEVNELRTLKLSPQCYMKMSPPTTLTMCSQCERVMSSTKTSSTSCQAATKEPPITTALLL